MRAENGLQLLGEASQVDEADVVRELDQQIHVAVEPVDLEAYANSGLPVETMCRTIAEDPLFFAAPLASGAALAKAAGGGS